MIYTLRAMLHLLLWAAMLLIFMHEVHRLYVSPDSNPINFKSPTDRMISNPAPLIHHAARRPEDVGRALKVTVTPRTSTGTEGEPAEALTEAPVKPCPAETASTRRGELTPTFLDPPAFR
jgi:hypothetical protein